MSSIRSFCALLTPLRDDVSGAAVVDLSFHPTTPALVGGLNNKSIVACNVAFNPGQPVPADYRVFAYSLSGMGFYGEGEARQEIDAQKMVVFQNDGDCVTLTAGAEPLEVLLLGGVPLKEPVVRYGPFVMNTEDEIRQAVVDYQAGRMGAITH